MTEIVKDPDIKYIGLLGGVASGKSTVAGFLEELGACVIPADRFAHEVLDLPEVRDQMLQAAASWLDLQAAAMQKHPHQQVSDEVRRQLEVLGYVGHRK